MPSCLTSEEATSSLEVSALSFWATGSFWFATSDEFSSVFVSSAFELTSLDVCDASLVEFVSDCIESVLFSSFSWLLSSTEVCSVSKDFVSLSDETSCWSSWTSVSWLYVSWFDVCSEVWSFNSSNCAS